MHQDVEEDEKLSRYFDINFEKKLLNLLIADPEFLIKCNKFLKKEFFSNETLSWVYAKIIWYYETYQQIITFDVFCTEIKKLPEESKQLEYLYLVSEILETKVTEKEFILDKIKEWLQRNLFVRSFKNAAILFNNGKFDKSLEQMNQTLEAIRAVNFSPPERTFFFPDIENRLLKRNSTSVCYDKISTGVFKLDTVINEGLAPGEMGVVVGPPKTGKSIFLVNCVGHAIRCQKKVLHIQLEGTPKQCEDRIEAKLLNIDYRKIVRNDVPPSVFKQYKYFDNSLVIRFLTDHWDYTVQDIEQELKELKAYNFAPDLVTVDYGDLLSPRTASLKDNTYLAQQEVFRDLKTLAMKHMLVLWTASQVTRAPKAANPRGDSNFVWTRNELADSFAKVRVCDLLITLNMTDDEQKAHRMRIYLDAYRDDERGQILPINTNFANMQFYCPNAQDMDDHARKSHQYERE